MWLRGHVFAEGDAPIGVPCQVRFPGSSTRSDNLGCFPMPTAVPLSDSRDGRSPFLERQRWALQFASPLGSHTTVMLDVIENGGLLPPQQDRDFLACSTVLSEVSKLRNNVRGATNA